MCKSMMSTDYQAVVAGQVGKWGVAVRMRTRPADQIQGKPGVLRRRGEPHLAVSDLGDNLRRSDLGDHLVALWQAVFLQL